jgi:site-specific recombinase XerD
LITSKIRKNITPHSLRKRFIELALDNDVDLISICNATGHGSIEMVKYYDGRDKLKK